MWSSQQRAPLLALLWCTLCITGTLCYWHRMEPTARSLCQLYFQPLLPPILMLWLWAHNVRAFEQQQVPYAECFSPRDRRALLSSGDLARLALAASTTVSTWACLFVWTAAGRMYLATEYIPTLLYCSLIVLLALPFNALGRGGRLLFLQTVQRVLLPVQAVSWADFLLADMFTSLAKSTGDMAQAVCTMATGPSLQQLSSPSFRPDPSLCSPLSTLGLAAVCLPYLIRLLQCLIVWRTTGNTSQVFNALKYCSAFPSLILTAFEHEAHVNGRPFPRFTLWIAAATFNTVFSYYWDLEMDWDMPWLAAAASQQMPQVFGPAGSRAASHAHHHPASGYWPRRVLGALRRGMPYLRPRVLYPTPWYLWLGLSNLVLRLGWTHRLVGNLEASAIVSLAMALLEVFRRYQWTFVRIETELRKLRLLPLPLVSQGGAPATATAVVVADGQGLLHEPKELQLANGSAAMHSHTSVHLIKHVASAHGQADGVVTSIAEPNS